LTKLLLYYGGKMGKKGERKGRKGEREGGGEALDL
jgi:hypothetical protein